MSEALSMSMLKKMEEKLLNQKPRFERWVMGPNEYRLWGELLSSIAEEINRRSKESGGNYVVAGIPDPCNSRYTITKE